MRYYYVTWSGTWDSPVSASPVLELQVYATHGSVGLYDVLPYKRAVLVHNQIEYMTSEFLTYNSCLHILLLSHHPVPGGRVCCNHQGYTDKTLLPFPLLGFDTCIHHGNAIQSSSALPTILCHPTHPFLHSGNCLHHFVFSRVTYT